jgi:tetratricopeptide (TPR) repeat protein
MGTRFRLLVFPAMLAVAFLLVSRGSEDSRAKEERLWQHRNLGKAFYENQTTRDEAVDEFRKALELAPESLLDRVNYGLALLRTRKVEEGVAELERVQKADPSIPHTWFNLGVTYKKNGDYPRAIAQFRRMAELVPEEPITHFNLGVLYRYTGKTDDALKEFEIAAKLDPNFAAPLFQIFDTYREAERMQEAGAALKRFQLLKQRQDPDADAEDTNWSYYSEIYEIVDPKNAAREPSPPAEVKFEGRTLAGTVDPQTAGMIAPDVDGDGLPELLVWSSAGIRVYRNGLPMKQEALASLKDVMSVSAGDSNNDGLPELAVLTSSGPLLFVNEKGTYRKLDVPLPAGRFEKAVWLDFDHDHDADLFLLGERCALLRNIGSGGFDDRTAAFPFVAGHAIDAVAFRLVADTKAIDLLVSYKDRPAVLYKDRLLGNFEAQTLDQLPAGAGSLSSLDVDNDGSIDVVFHLGKTLGVLRNRLGKLERAETGIAVSSGYALADLETRGLADLIAGQAVYRNQGMLKFAGATKPAGLPDAVAWLQAEFDCDGRPDLAAIAPDGSVHQFMNQTRTENNWVAVTLTGVKNPKLAPGTEIEVKAGTNYQKKVYTGLPLSFGLRNFQQVDAVRITWPNGMIQNETRQPANRMLKFQEAPKLSGSCPMIFTWNGQRFEFITDVLGVAPLGASAGNGQFFAVDHDEYVQIPGRMLLPRDGRYEVRITEELSEVSYLDQARLIAVDHPSNVEIFSNDKWKSPPFPEFRLYGVNHRVYPRRARNHRGRDVLDRLVRRDLRYVDGFARDYEGVAEQHWVELDFGDVARSNRAILVLNGWVDWADGSTFLKVSQQKGGGLQPPYLQVKDERGEWQTVIEDMGMPSGKTKTLAVDLTGKFLSKSREVRIVTSMCVYWDEIFLGEDSGAPEVRLTAMDASSADLRFRGFSKVLIHPERRQPERFVYDEVRPVSTWNPTPGWYTRYGDVRELMRVVDDRLVVMGPGDELRLSYDAARLPSLPEGWTRDFLLLVDGWEKDRDANTAYSQTVEPLPFHGMTRYPYGPAEHHPDEAYRRQWNTRPALRLIPPLAGD